MLANWITLSRLPLLLISVLLLYRGSPAVQLWGVALLFVGLMLDTVDGVVARRTRRTSLFGSVLDIAADRTYELVLWVALADLRLVPMAIPLIVVARTTLTDALRSIGTGTGTAPFAQHRSTLARFLVGSTLMRTGYSVGKIATFCGLMLARVAAGSPGTPLSTAAVSLLVPLQVAAWLTAGMCVVRGLPVIVDSLRRHLGGDPPSAAGAGRDRPARAHHARPQSAERNQRQQAASHG